MKTASAFIALTGLLMIVVYSRSNLDDRTSLYMGVVFLVGAVVVFFSSKIEKMFGISRHPKDKGDPDQTDGK